MTIQTAFRLKKTLVDKLKKYCETEGRSQTWVANKAFSDYLGLTQKEPTGVVSEKSPVVKKADNGLREVRYLFVPAQYHDKYRDALKSFIGDIEVESCFSCDKGFIVNDHNDRDEGYFCDDCLDSQE